MSTSYVPRKKEPTEEETHCPYDGIANSQIPGYVSGYGCPVCKAIGAYHVPVGHEELAEHAVYVFWALLRDKLVTKIYHVVLRDFVSSIDWKRPTLDDCIWLVNKFDQANTSGMFRQAFDPGLAMARAIKHLRNHLNRNGKVTILTEEEANNFGK